jgi:hypothetical protein
LSSRSWSAISARTPVVAHSAIGLLELAEL